MFEQADILTEFTDFLYLDVISSTNEVKAALNISKKLNKKVLIGIHLKKNGNLPSEEKIEQLLEIIQDENTLGVVCACISPEISLSVLDKFLNCEVPFGFKINLWGVDEPGPIQTFNTAKPHEIGVNPNQSLGKRDNFDANEFYNLSKKFIEGGATILGGCCETKPEHISAISSFKL